MSDVSLGSFAQNAAYWNNIQQLAIAIQGSNLKLSPVSVYLVPLTIRQFIQIISRGLIEVGADLLF